MSSPSPGPPSITEVTYQPSETSDALLSHSHSCLCPEKHSDISAPNQKTLGHHNHNILGIGNTNVHVVHVHSTPTSGVHVTKTTQNVHNECMECGEHHVTDVGVRKLDEDSIEVSPLPPALPPRPPPRPRNDASSTLGPDLRTRSRISSNGANGGGIRKYVFWCTICGGFATILGALFLAVYFMLRSYTSTLGYFETIPTFVPATMLILTGLCVMSLARRRNRYSYLIKVCGVCCLVCALTCVLVTITTTVIHMNRLQTLRECVYTQKTRTCTCYSVLLEAHADAGEGMRFVFDSTPDCEVIHGALYSCLRAMFGLSVSGILVCIFSCMLVYQLLSHERKKMYWEQLELRCRSLYQQGSTISTQGSVRGPPAASTTYCSCCEECRYPPVPAGHIYPWETHHAIDRFWTPGRVGNFYSPNPGEEGVAPATGERRERERSAGWSWRRLPWNRNNNQQHVTDNQRDATSMGYHMSINSPDSQYGFSTRSAAESGLTNTLSDPMTGSSGSYSMLDNRPVGGVYVWGPPPPYSNPNSPARRILHSPARYHHIHHHPHTHSHAHTTHCQMNEESQSQSSSDCQMRRSRGGNNHFPSKDNYENATESELHQMNDNNESTDTSSCAERINCNSIAVRKSKKRMDMISHTYPEEQRDPETSEEHSYQEPDIKSKEVNQNSPQLNNQQCRFLPRLQGVENAAFQNQEGAPQKTEPTESEVYFADVSSCCNISVRNDGQDSSLYDEALEMQKTTRFKQKRIPESDNLNENEDYLAQRIGKRQMSTRSRLPFPLPNSDNLTLTDLNSESCLQLLSKDISQNSLGSIQTPLTESTDDGMTPSSSFNQNECCLNYYPEKNSFANNEQFLAPDAQYEVIQQQNDPQSQQQSFSNLTNTISGLNNYDQGYKPQNFNSNLPSKNMNLSPRRNIGSNISTLIQNLGVNPVGLLYGEAMTDEEVQGQACHSDGTMDSGWQSGSEKQDVGVRNENVENTVQRSVNV